jgi:hypothetical protein
MTHPLSIRLKLGPPAQTGDPPGRPGEGPLKTPLYAGTPLEPLVRAPINPRLEEEPGQFEGLENQQETNGFLRTQGGSSETIRGEFCHLSGRVKI